MAGYNQASPDIFGAVQRGREVGRQNNLRNLSAQYFANGQQADPAFLSQVAHQGGPEAAAYFQKDQQAQKAEKLKQLGQAAAWFTSLPADAKPQAYQQLAQLATQSGFANIPQQYDPQHEEPIAKLAEMFGGAAGAGNVQSTYIDNQGNRVAIMRDGSTQVLGQNAPNNQILLANGGFVGVNKGNLQASPVTMGGNPAQATPQGQGAQFALDDAALQALSQVPPQERAAALQAMMTGGDFHAGPNGQAVQGLSGGQQPGPQLQAPPPKPVAANALASRITLAKQMGATDEQVKSMVLGASAANQTPESNQDDLTFYAQMENAGDHSWKTGLGRGGGTFIRQVMERAAKNAIDAKQAPQDISAFKSYRESLAKTLTQRQEYASAVKNLNGTLDRQASLVESLLAKGAAGGQSPILNRWIQAGRKEIAGDPDVTALNAAIVGLGREHQRVLTAPLSNAQLAVSAAETADQIISKDMTVPQILKTIQVMKTEARNGLDQNDQTLADLRYQLAHINRPGDSAAPAAPQGANNGWSAVKVP